MTNEEISDAMKHRRPVRLNRNMSNAYATIHEGTAVKIVWSQPGFVGIAGPGKTGDDPFSFDSNHVAIDGVPVRFLEAIEP